MRANLRSVVPGILLIAWLQQVLIANNKLTLQPSYSVIVMCCNDGVMANRPGQDQIPESQVESAD